MKIPIRIKGAMLLVALIIPLLTISAHASFTYDCTFHYYMGSQYVDSAGYRAISSGSPDDSWIINTVGPNNAPSSLQGLPYTCTQYISHGNECTYIIEYHYSAPTYFVTYNITGTLFTGSSSYGCAYNSTQWISTPAAHPGYNFNGWTSADVSTGGSSFTMPSHNVTLYGYYTPRNDTPFSVSFYQQNLSGDGYTQVSGDAVTGQGTTGDKIINYVNVSSYTNKYTGFHLVGDYSLDATAINGDGTATLKLYYDRNLDTPFSVNFFCQNAADDNYVQINGDTLTSQGMTGAAVLNYLDAAAINGKYPGFHLSDGSKNDTTAIAGSGTSVLNLYYDRDTPNVTYSFTGKIPLANPAATAASPHRYGSTVGIAEIPTLAGYDFGGWSSGDIDVSSGSFTMPANEVAITGTWIPHTDTAFTVEVYQQNIEDDGYTKLDAGTFCGQGTTDTLIQNALDMSALESKYPGFHLSDGSRNGTSTIDGSGTSVLKLYYDRDTPDVIYSFAGKHPLANPSAPATVSHRYGSTVSIAEIPTLAGYDFSGWSSTDLDVSSGCFTMPDSDVIVTGTWIPHTDTPFAVEVYQQNIEDDGYTKADAFSEEGTTDTRIVQEALGTSALDAKYPGFHLTDGSLADATTINGGGSTVLNLYYDRNIANVAYAYNYAPKNAPELPKQVATRYGATVNVDAAPELIGYEFSGWSSAQADLSSGIFSMPDGVVVITGEWTPLPEPYRVEYYLQELDGSYTLTDKEDCTGLTDAQALAPAKGYEGFTETSTSKDAETNTTICGDGSTVLKLYFDRNTYTVSYAYQGETDVTPPELPAAATYRYGETVTVSTMAPSLQGYDFGGWRTQDAEIADGCFTVPAKDVTITGAWYPKDGIPFQVMYYQQNLKDDEFTLVDTVDGKGVTGAVIPNIHREYEGFIETPTSLSAEETKIASNGNTAVKLYFARGHYSVSFAYSGGDAIPSNAPVLPAAQTYKFGETVTLPDKPVTSMPGKYFSGWFINGQAVSANTFLMPGEDAVVSGVWYSPSGDSVQKTVPVSFIIDATTVESKEVKSGDQIKEPAAPTKNGYTFAGWYTDSAYSKSWDFSTGTVTTSLVLYAKWVPEQYSVTFESNGGSSVPEQTVAYGGLATRPTAPKRTGYTFASWYADSTLSDAWSFSEDTVLADTMLYAAWTARQFTVSFVSNGGSSVPAQTVTYGGLATRPTAPTRNGYTFTGWYAASALSNAWSFTEDTVLTNITLYAKWVATVLPTVSTESGESSSGNSRDVPSDNLTITFDSAGGSTISAQFIRYGQLLAKPVNPEKAGCTFAGWYTDPDCTHAWSFPTTVSRNTTLYAKWIMIEEPEAVVPVVEKSPADSAEAPLKVSYRINVRMILAAAAALCLVALFTLLAIRSRRVKFYYIDGEGAYRTLCHGTIRDRAIDITAAYQAANEGTVMVRISKFYALRHLGGQISIHLKGNTLLTDQLGLNNKYVIGET